MKRVIVLVLDSLGIGSTDDAHLYSDTGSNTLGHIAKHCKLHIPNLSKLGLVKALEASCGSRFNLNNSYETIGIYGYSEELSKGKDTVSGHWEMAGCPVLSDWGYFSNFTDSFPKNLLYSILQKANLQGYLGNCRASGTEVIVKFGEEHIKTGYPIFYTSADSVFQIAAHEEYFGLNRLYQLCEITRKELDQYNIGRVIARPFIGSASNNFIRTANRRDYAVPPVSTTLLDIAKSHGINVVAIGKTRDIFAHKGITSYLKTPWNEGNVQDTLTAMKTYTNKALIFTNLADFDVLYGHRRDVQGYANAINYFDKRLEEILYLLQSEDLLIITADHGNDPTWYGTDHTREHVPILAYYKGMIPKYIGKRKTFADIGQTVATYLQLPKLSYGESFI